MADLPEKRFSFLSDAVAADSFTVVRFRGDEGLSRCYRFEVELAAQDANLDLKSILSAPATFTIHRPEGDIPFHGILSEFQQLHRAGVYTFYKAVLTPRMWWLSLTHHNQVFLDRTAPQLLSDCLLDGGLTAADFDQRLQRGYPSWEYACQHRESHFDFISRWMEREGIYYYFEQTDDGEKVVLTDTRVAHGPMPEGETLRYRDLAAMEHFHREEVVWGLTCHQHLLPKSLRLKDYNYNTPTLDLSASAPVSPDGRGEWYLYGEHFLTPEEGANLASVRSEELRCREQRFTGESAIPFLRPGYTFVLQDHYRDSYNQKYLTVALQHEGSQAAYLLAGLGMAPAPGEEEPYYRNRFTAIPAAVQFRPERKTEKARFYGSLNAKVDGAGSGQYAELDELGRYKVILPFDLSGRKDGKASAWLRMMQPYAGSDHGMHFPLHKGTEVLLTFIDGDPDRPVIAGAVPNPSTPSPVTGDNQTMAMLQTAGKNKIAMEDKEGSQRILLQTPVANSWLRMGAPNDPPTAPTPTPTPTRPVPPTPTPTPTPPPTTTPTPTETEKKDDEDHHKTEDGIYVYTDGPWHLVGAKADVQILGESFEFVLGLSQIIICGDEMYVKLVSSIDITLGWNLEWKLGHTLGVGTHTEWKMSHQGFHLEKVDVEGNIQQLRGDITNLTGVANVLQGDLQQMNGTVNHLQGDVQNLTGVNNVLQGDLQQLNGTVNNLQGDVQNLTGVINIVNGEVQDLSGAVNRVEGDVNSLAGVVNVLNGEQTNMSGEIANLAGIINML